MQLMTEENIELLSAYNPELWDHERLHKIHMITRIASKVVSSTPNLEEALIAEEELVGEQNRMAGMVVRVRNECVERIENLSSEIRLNPNDKKSIQKKIKAQVEGKIINNIQYYDWVVVSLLVLSLYIFFKSWNWWWLLSAFILAHLWAPWGKIFVALVLMPPFLLFLEIYSSFKTSREINSREKSRNSTRTEDLTAAQDRLNRLKKM